MISNNVLQYSVAQINEILDEAYQSRINNACVDESISNLLNGMQDNPILAVAAKPLILDQIKKDPDLGYVNAAGYNEVLNDLIGRNDHGLGIIIPNNYDNNGIKKVD